MALRDFTIAVIMPLAILIFIIGNYTLYERTLGKYATWIRYAVVIVVFIVQEYVITNLSYQKTGYAFYQYVIPILVYNLLDSPAYGVVMAFLAPVTVNVTLVLFNGQPAIYWDLFFDLLLFLAVVAFIRRFDLRGSMISITIQMLVITLGGPQLIRALDYYGIMKVNVPTKVTVALFCGVMVILVIYHFILREEILSINQNKQARHNSLFDELTGLANYRSLVDYTETDKMNQRAGSSIVCIVDMDYFKTVNDQYGHQSGNQALKYLADYLLAAYQTMPHGKVRIFRYGGEEFCLVFTGLATTDFAGVVDGIRNAQERFGQQPFVTHDGQQLPLSFSAGVTVWYPGEELITVFDRADQALYSAKLHGRSQVRIFTGRPAERKQKDE